MKVLIEFNLPDEIDYLDDALQGTKLKAVIHEFDNILRSKLKHTEEEGSFEEARDLLWECLHDYNIRDIV